MWRCSQSIRPQCPSRSCSEGEAQLTAHTVPQDARHASLHCGCVLYVLPDGLAMGNCSHACKKALACCPAQAAFQAKHAYSLLVCEQTCYGPRDKCCNLMQAFDGSCNSKWLDFGAAKDAPAWLEYRSMPNQAPGCVEHYTLVSADDEPSRDPCDFSLEGYIGCPTGQGKGAAVELH